MKTSSLLRTCLCVLALSTSSMVLGPAVAAERGAPLASDPMSDLMDRRYDELRRTSLSSDDLRLRILFSRDTSLRDDATNVVDLVPLAALLDAARGSTDPLVLQLLIGRCGDDEAPSACEPVALARRWTEADAQNQAAWITLATWLERRGDPAGARDAWEQVGRASTIRDPMYDYARVIDAALPVDRDARLRHLDLLFVLGVAAAVPAPWLLDATQGCRESAHQRACAHLADVAFRDATTFVMLHVGSRTATAARTSSTVVADRRRSEQALLWAQGRLMESTDFMTFGAGDQGAWQKANRILEDQIARGEIAPARDALRAERLSDAAGAARYASTAGESAGRKSAR